MAHSETRLLAARSPDLSNVIFVSSSPGLPPTRPMATATPQSSWRDRHFDVPLLGSDPPAGGMLPPAASRPHEYVVLGSTPDSAARTALPGQIHSKYFADSPAASATSVPSVAAEAPTLPAEKYVTGDLEHAVQRRRDWTPPPTDTVIFPGTGSPLPLEEWSSPSALAGRTDVFKSLHNSFGCKLDDESSSNNTGSATARESSFTKRKPIETISIGDSGKAGSKASSAKTKAPKKKPRTLTELAVAAYADASTTGDDVTTTTMTTAATKRQLDVIDETLPLADPEVRPGFPTSKLRKLKTVRPAAAPKKKSRAKKAPQPRKPVLLSPESARAESMHQNFLFGTSSQLASEQSPMFQRHLHDAMQESNQDERNSLLDLLADASTVDLTSKDATAPGQTKLWGAAARGEDGHLAFDNVIDLEDSIEFPEDPHQVIAMAQRAAEEAQHKVPGDSAPATAEKGTAKGGSEQPPPLAQSSRGMGKHLPQSIPTEIKSAQPLGSQFKQTPLPPSTQKERKEATRPNFEVLTTAQLSKKVSAYGYKAMRARPAMVALLNQCWEAQNLPPTGQVLSPIAPQPNDTTATTTPIDELAQSKPKPARPSKAKYSTKTAQTTSGTATLPRTSIPKPKTSVPPGARAAIHTTTKTGAGAIKPTPSTTSQARKDPDERIIFEIEDSESDGRFSSLERTGPIASNDDADAATDDDDNENENGNDIMATDDEDEEADLSLAGASLTGEESELFQYISTAVVSAPRANDPANPSWHEKILMYDTIILETFTAWLNDGQLRAAGYEGIIEPAEAKKWCESKSVCCTWRKNLHGKERKL